jgi:hypothetical protein
MNKSLQLNLGGGGGGGGSIGFGGGSSFGFSGVAVVVVDTAPVVASVFTAVIVFDASGSSTSIGTEQISSFNQSLDV